MVSDEKIRDAYQMFLGRVPGEIASLSFKTPDELINTLFHSQEFRASPRSRKNTLGWPERQYLFARDKKVLYCPIGKNACTFFKQAMVNLAEHPHRETISHSVHFLTDHVKTGMQLSDYGLDDVGNFLADPDVFRFAILRDPARRLLSAYIEKFVKNRTEHANVKFHTSPVVNAVQRAAGITDPDYDRGISFSDLVSHIILQQPEKLDPHWRPQYLYLEGHEWPNLYTFETLPQAVADLEKISGVKLNRPPANKSGSGVGVPHLGADTLLPAEIDALPMIDESSFLTPAIRAQLEEYYVKDYDILKSISG
jgi:hypothetical protein